jgi:hypothetical protein
VKATVIALTPETRELFKQMSFQEIPDLVKYVAFLEDGTATFLGELDIVGVSLPTYTVFRSYEIADLRLKY